MAIPELNQYGLLPAGIHEADFIEVERAFAGRDKTHRSQLWSGLKRFLDMLSAKGALACVACIYIDGSFTTDKPMPGDIDLVFEVNLQAPLSGLSILMNETGKTKQNHAAYGTHAFVHIPGLGGGGMHIFFQHLKEHDAMSRKIKLLPKTAQKGIIRTYYE